VPGRHLTWGFFNRRFWGSSLRCRHAALTTPWSNAQAEGQITKLKLIKRLMYGQAGF
jgi:transposase